MDIHERIEQLEKAGLLPEPKRRAVGADADADDADDEEEEDEEEEDQDDEDSGKRTRAQLEGEFSDEDTTGWDEEYPERRAAIAAAKCEITTALDPQGVVVIPAGDPLLEAALADVWSGRVVRVRLDIDAPVAADLIGAIDAEMLLLDGDRFRLPLQGRHNARNVLLAVAVARELGLPQVPGCGACRGTGSLLGF